MKDIDMSKTCTYLFIRVFDFLDTELQFLKCCISDKTNQVDFYC